MIQGGVTAAALHCPQGVLLDFPELVEGLHAGSASRQRFRVQPFDKLREIK